MSVNKVILLGNCGRDPEVREGGNGKWATFSLATSERAYTNKNGIQVPERTEWHNIVVFGNTVNVVEARVTKGTKLYIEGKLRTRKYNDRNNQERSTTEVVVDTLELLGSAPQATGQRELPQGAPRIMVNVDERPPMPGIDDLPAPADEQSGRLW